MTNQIKWLDIEVAKSVNCALIKRHGVSQGLRDEALLISAMYSPLNYFAYNTNSDVFMFAAIYAYKITMNHAFIDGNKRTACAMLMAFLAKNGVEINASDDEKVNLFLLIAQGEINEDGIYEWLKKSSQKG